MELEQIGFYTLEDSRAKEVNKHTPLWRCELILTDKCNFTCPYCRGVTDEHKGSMVYEQARSIVELWANQGLKNIRFSGGEPAYWKGLLDLVKYTKSRGVERIAISTNGSADLDFYKELHEAGINDFSISLDACCAETGDKMAGGKKGVWQKLTDNIRELSKLTYVTVGVVLTEDNIDEFHEIVEFASEDLGVSDIRIISAAQWNRDIDESLGIKQHILDKNPILKYRVENLEQNRHVRGITENDNHQCPLALDDMAVLNGYHFPCIIYMREQGDPIGKIGEDVRDVRDAWVKNHNTFKDPICNKNCLDVCVDYNNRVKQFQCSD